jgi:hypothetical protein
MKVTIPLLRVTREWGINSLKSPDKKETKMTLLTNKRSIRISLLATLITFSLLFTGPAIAEEKKSVSIQPFAIHAPEDLSYLQNGVKAMLSSRLSANGGATVIDTGADFIVTGSITSLGESISLDAKVTSTATGAEESFYSSAAGQNDIIAAITDLSWQISEKIFGKQRPAQQVVTVPAGRPSVSAQGEPAAATRTPHPEKSFITRSPLPATATPSPLLGSSVREAAGFTKLPNFRMDLKGMDIGDVDGDGLADVVAVGNKEMIVYRNSNGRYEQMASYPLSATYPAHGVGVADLNGNGLAEIYISAADYEKPRSIGLEWNGNSFSTLFSKAPWYIRVSTLPGHGMSLIGQRTETSAAFRAGIFRLERQGNTLIPEEKIAVPDYINLFDFTMDDIDGDGSQDIIAISQTDILYVLRANGSLAWQSDDHFGGVTRYVGGEDDSKYSAIDTDRESDGIGMEEKSERVYIPTRIIATDLNGDGIKDVLVNKNLSTASRLFKRIKNYPSGEIYGLTWDGLGLAELWRSRKINGYVADYQILPGKDGNPATLFVAVILKSGWMGSFTTPESTVLMYTLQ